MSLEALPLASGLAERFLPKRFQSHTAILHEPRTATTQPELTVANGFVQKKTLEVAGREFRAYHVEPTDPSVDYQGRIFLANGWRARVAIQQPYITKLVEAGYSVTSFDNDFTHGDKGTMKQADKALNAGKHPKIEFVKAQAVKTTLDAFPSRSSDEKIGLVAHSEGTIYAGIAALSDKEGFDYFVQINSAGLAKPTSVLGIAARGGIESIICQRNGFYPKDHDEGSRQPFEAITYVAQNLGTAVPELRAIAKMKTERLVAHVKKRGLPTGIVHGKRDKIFPGRNLKRFINEGLFDSVAEVEKGSHEIITNPEEYAEKTLVTIAELRAQKAKKEAVLFVA